MRLLVHLRGEDGVRISEDAQQQPRSVKVPTLVVESSVSCLESSLLPDYRGGPLWCTGFRRVFRSRKWGRQIGQKLNVETGSRRRRNSEKNTGRHQPPPQAHFTSPNPPRPSRRSVSDGVIQLIFVFGAMLSLVQRIGLAREGLACEN